MSSFLIFESEAAWLDWSQRRELAKMVAATKPAGNFARFDFGEAIKRLKEGDGVARAGWNGKGLWLEHVKSCDKQLAYVRLHYPGGTNVPWAPSQTDMLAEDWFVV